MRREAYTNPRPYTTQNAKYCPSQPRAMGCGLIRGLTPVATHAHADAPDYRSRSHLRGRIFTKPSQRSRALTPLNTPPATGSFNSPWPSMSGAGKRNRACERATPYPPGQSTENYYKRGRSESPAQPLKNKDVRHNLTGEPSNPTLRLPRSGSQCTV